ncbi:hypothetical protein PQX77_002858, partial [Marasmius sp. AFHP31]
FDGVTKIDLAGLQDLRWQRLMEACLSESKFKKNPKKGKASVAQIPFWVSGFFVMSYITPTKAVMHFHPYMTVAAPRCLSHMVNEYDDILHSLSIDSLTRNLIVSGGINYDQRRATVRGGVHTWGG